MRAGALRGIHRDLPGNVTAVQKRRSHFGKLLVSDRNRRDHAFIFVLFDQFKIARHFVSGERQQLFDLKTNHLGELRGIDAGQTKPLRNHGRYR